MIRITIRPSAKSPLQRLAIPLAALMLGGCAVTPEPLSRAVIQQQMQQSIQSINQTPDPIAQAIDLNEAIARSLKHNRERRLQVLEAALAQGQLELASFDLLPQLAVSAGYAERDSYAASASTTFNGNSPAPLPGDPSYSVSQDKRTKSASIAFSWNVLDFGLSYVRAQQQADRYLIAKERERKVVHQIVQDVGNAFQRARSAQRLLTRIDPILEQTQQALSASREIEKSRAQTPLEALNYQRELLDNLRILQTLRQELITAKTELATLMGLAPGQDFTLAGVDQLNYIIPKIALDINTMEQAALTLRPEVIETQYQKRISAKDARAALLGLLPGINLNAGLNYDSSQYLRHNDWTSAGLQVSWNLLNVFKQGKVARFSDLQAEVAEQRALATAVGVLSQLHMATARYQEAINAYQIADQYYDVALRIQAQVRSAQQSQSRGELELIRENLTSLLAELRRDAAFAELQNSFGRIMVSLGLDLVPSGFNTQSLDDLTHAIRQNLANWQSGQLDLSSAQ